MVETKLISSQYIDYIQKIINLGYLKKKVDYLFGKET